MAKEKVKALFPTVDEVEQFVKDSGCDDIPAFGGTFEGGIHAQQIPDEIARCILALLQTGEPIKNYLEIGSASGGTCFLLNNYLAFDNIVLVDDNQHHKAQLRPGILKGIKRTEIIGNSNFTAVLEKVAALDISFDLLFIDADHSYVGVWLDVDNYLPFLRPGGFLLLHDSAMPDFGIYKCKDELRGDPRVIFMDEFVSQKYMKVCGIAMFKKAGGE